MEAQEFGVVRERSETPTHEASAWLHEVKIDVDAADAASGGGAAGGGVGGLSGRAASDDKMSEVSMLSDMGVGNDNSLTAPLMPTGSMSSRSSTGESAFSNS